MIDYVRPATRQSAVAHSRQIDRTTWGIVDVILGVIMLPFGIWMGLIQLIVSSLTSFGDRPPTD